MSSTRAAQILSPSPYDAIAEFYQRAWANWYLPSIRPFLRNFLFSILPKGAAVLDACCGCGHVTREVSAQGYRVVGVDASRELIARATRDIPQANFIVGDIRSFSANAVFDGALSTFDSLNHLLEFEDLCAALRCIRMALKPDAAFVFDMNLEEAYSLDLASWVRYEDENAIGFVRGQYNWETQTASTELLWFVREKDREFWRRSDALIHERCYSIEQISSAVRLAGFRKFERYSAYEVGITDDLGYGRLYGRAWA